MFIEQDLFELNVYRLKEDDYLEKRFEYIKKKRLKYQKTQIQQQEEDAYLSKMYGGEWQYNEIIGFLKFYQKNNKIRCTYWETDALRKVKTRKKQFQYITDKFCNTVFFKSYSNKQLIEVMKSSVEHCKGRDEMKNRFIDSSIFDNIVNYLNWKELLMKGKT